MSLHGGRSFGSTGDALLRKYCQSQKTPVLENEEA